MVSPKPREILIVDDDLEVVELISKTLKVHHFRAIAATQWIEAIEALENGQPDLLLLDLRMPTINGQTLLRFIRDQGYTVPAIVVSGFITDEIVKSLRPLGVRAFVHKPFQLADLTREIERVLAPGASSDVDVRGIIRKMSGSEASGEGTEASDGPSEAPSPVSPTPEPVSSHHVPGALPTQLPPRRHHRAHRHRNPNPPAKFQYTNLFYMGVIAVVCILIAIFLTVMSKQQATRNTPGTEQVRP